MNRGFGGGILAIIPKAQSTEVGSMLDFIKFKNFHSAENVELTLSTTPKKSSFFQENLFPWTFLLRRFSLRVWARIRARA